MFKAPFSFEGRIRRTEFGLSVLINAAVIVVMEVVMGVMLFASASYNSSSSTMVFALIFLVLLVPLLWFAWAQGAKRCHDLGNSGWYQLIPFYGLWLLFAEGNPGANEYGDNPKEPPVYTPHTGLQNTTSNNGNP
jgi:uncharacterized membrane protein YhaH (DUF805 family)